ncbi:peptidylprolyl isomerase [Echinicola strongylocentroti]|uniref:Peptidylprolyl isomerase n=1 Tax=Echinicola strongylocentroti TaxID=1795355 RepID=A0A2Z4IPM9_9BACT|nr:peptidylprolyl isomerase [Echinicola strongylocentroti]AWW33121.1 peptidylprolyl isomerase [Echinicola strongylocentroti]
MKTTYQWLCVLGFLVACSPNSKVSQNTSLSDEPQYLLTVGNENVPAEEFLHMLSKNRDFDQASEKLSEKDFEDNFELFINYKLKVKEAEALGMDQSEEFQREFNAFKEDLKKPYVLETSLQEGETQKAYARMKDMVHAQHVLLRFPPRAVKADSIAVFKMATKIKEKAETGEDFSKLALEYSQDPSVQKNQGDLGYFTSLQMVYPFEDAVYQLQPGEISNPVLTDFGYHIIKLIDRKPNPGQVKVSHILVRTDPTDPLTEDRARRKITDIYSALQNDDTSWKSVCTTYSEDASSRENGGTLPWFGVGSLMKEFEEAAFSLSELGEISSPVKTSYGYHIIRLEDKKPLASYEEMEESLRSKILRDSRSELIRSQVTAIQKARYQFSENTPIIHQAQQLAYEHSPNLNDIRKVYAAQHLMDSTLFSIGSAERKVAEFVEFVEKDNAVVKTDKKKPFDAWMEKFTESTLNQTEEADLMTHNDDYRLLVNEYKEGILLFNLMNEQVWQKALKDTAGLMEYFENHRDRYTWDSRTEALLVTVLDPVAKKPTNDFLRNKNYQQGLKAELQEQLEDISTLSYKIEEGTFEISKHAVLREIGHQAKLQEVTVNNKSYIVLLGKQYPPGPKAFNETRGKAIKDYQEYLDQNLIGLLKQNYIIQVNEDEKARIQNIVVEQN